MTKSHSPTSFSGFAHAAKQEKTTLVSYKSVKWPVSCFQTEKRSQGVTPAKKERGKMDSYVVLGRCNAARDFMIPLISYIQERLQKLPQIIDAAEKVLQMVRP